MFERLEQIETRYEELGSQLADPEIIADQPRLPESRQAAPRPRARRRQVPRIPSGHQRHRRRPCHAHRVRSRHPRHGPGRAYPARRREPKLEEELKLLLLPKDPNDEKDVIVEIRGGAGGEEAALFAAEMFRMYTRFAEQHRWKVEVLSSSDSSVGGLQGSHRHLRGRQGLLAAQV